MEKRRRLPSAGTVLGTLALIVALSGVAIALPGRNSVNSGDIRNNAVKDRDIADVRFRPLTPINGWVPYGFGFNGPAVAKDGFGIVHLEGAINGASSSSADALRLPPRFRPARTSFQPVDTSGAVYGRVRISSDGIVQVSGSVASYEDFTSLEGVTFKGR